MALHIAGGTGCSWFEMRCVLPPGHVAWCMLFVVRQVAGGNGILAFEMARRFGARVCFAEDLAATAAVHDHTCKRQQPRTHMHATERTHTGIHPRIRVCAHARSYARSAHACSQIKTIDTHTVTHLRAHTTHPRKCKDTPALNSATYKPSPLPDAGRRQRVVRRRRLALG